MIKQGRHPCPRIQNTQIPHSPLLPTRNFMQPVCYIYEKKCVFALRYNCAPEENMGFPTKNLFWDARNNLFSPYCLTYHYVDNKVRNEEGSRFLQLISAAQNTFIENVDMTKEY